jgi:hypothetical protein
MSRSTARSERRLLPYVLAVLLLALAGAMAWRGWTFYVLSLDARPDHPDFRTLRPSGFIGNGYGYAGALLVFANLLYLARRRIPGFRIGSMRFWLDLHVFTGLAAALFVSFHSAFQLRTPIATTTALSLGVVVVTGLIGRFLYALVPKVDDQPLTRAIDALDQAMPGMRAPVMAAIGAFPPPVLAGNAGLIRAIAAVPRWRRVSHDRREALALVVSPHVNALSERASRRAGKKLLREVVKQSSAEVRAGSSAVLLRAWRSVHRFFAILMLLSVGAHVGIAWHYGYRWIFGP